MDPEEYEKIFGHLSLNDKKYPNDIKESEKRRIRKMSYKFYKVSCVKIKTRQWKKTKTQSFIYDYDNI